MKKENEFSTELLKKIQSNILKPHSRKYSWYFFISFLDVNPRQLRKRISLYGDSVTSAFEQRENTIAYKKYNEACKVPKEKRQEKHINSIKRYKENFEDEVMINFCLSSSGFEKLQIIRDRPKDRAFKNGIKNNFSQNILFDKINTWEERYKKTIDALIVISHDSEKRLEKSISKIKYIIKDVADIICDDSLPNHEYEKGMILHLNNDISNPVVEHFGFPDGMSQPVFWDEKNKLIEENLNIVLVKDAANGYGSYLVFRKLEQDVKSFNANVLNLAKKLYHEDQPSKKEIEFVEAQVIGRFKKDGSPLTHIKEPKGTKSNKNKIFNEYNPPKVGNLTKKNSNGYENDLQGFKCPFHAHVRKVNPRSLNPKFRFTSAYDDTYNQDSKDKIEIRIVRRGNTYDYLNNGEGRKNDLTDEPSKDVGLLFVSFQASISNQFEKILGWCNDRTFPSREFTKGEEVGIDPIVGKLSDYDKFLASEMKQSWNINYNGTSKEEKMTLGFSDVVRCKGGEYFFAPSIPFLEKLQKMK